MVAKNLIIRVKAEMGQYVEGMKTAGQSFETATEKIKTNSAKLQKAGLILSGAGLAVGAAIGGMTKQSMDFYRELGNVETLIPGQVGRINELGDAFSDLSIEVGKSAQDITAGGYQVISAFGDTADSVKILEISAKAATAGAATTTEAIDLLNAVTKGYGDTSAEAVQKAADLAFMTVKMGVTDFPQLAASIGRTAPLAAALGVSQEELFAVMATGTGTTGKAAEVNTQLAGIMRGLMEPSEDLKVVLRELGYNSGEAAIKGEGLEKVLRAVKDRNLETGISMQKMLGSSEAVTLALALTGGSADKFAESLAAAEKPMGMMAEAFKAKTQGVNAAGFAYDQMKQSMAAASREMGKQMIPIVTSAGKAVTGLLTGFTDFMQESPYLTKAIIVSAAAFSALATAVGAGLIGVTALPHLVAGFQMLGTVLPKVRIGMAATGTAAKALWASAFGPVGLLVAAASALIWFFHDDLIAAFKAATEWAGGLWKSFMEKIGKSYEEEEILAERKEKVLEGQARLSAIRREKYAKEVEKGLAEKQVKEDAAAAKDKERLEKALADEAAAQAVKEERAAAAAAKKEAALQAELQKVADKLAKEKELEDRAIDEHNERLIKEQGSYPGHYLAIEAAHGIHLDNMEKDTVDTLVAMDLDWQGYGESVTGMKAAEEDSIAGQIASKYGGFLSDMQLETATQLGLMGADFETYAGGIVAEGGPMNTMAFNIGSIFQNVRDNAGTWLSEIGSNFVTDIASGNMRGALTNLKGAFLDIGTNIKNDLVKTLSDGLMNWVTGGLAGIAKGFWNAMSSGSGGFFSAIGGALKSVLGGGDASAIGGAAGGAGAVGSIGGAIGGVGGALGGAAGAVGGALGGAAGAVGGLVGLGGTAALAVGTLGIGAAVAGLVLGIKAIFGGIPKHEIRRRDDAKDVFPLVAKQIEADYNSGKMSEDEARFKLGILQQAIEAGEVLNIIPKGTPARSKYKESDLAKHSGWRMRLLYTFMDDEWAKAKPKEVITTSAGVGGSATNQEPQSSYEYRAPVVVKSEPQSHKGQGQGLGLGPGDGSGSGRIVRDFFDETTGSQVRQATARAYNNILRQAQDKGKYNETWDVLSKDLEKYHSGGVIPGIMGQETMVRALAGEEILRIGDPRNRTTGPPASGGQNIVVNITGNKIDSLLDMKELAEKAGEEIFRTMRARGLVQL